MNADVDLTFYDTTSLHFEVDEADEAELGKRERRHPAQRKRGHSKNGRGDAPQIVIGLAVTRDGLPVRSWVFPGNTADVTTVERVKNDLRVWRLGRCVFVGDAAMNSEENRRSLSLGAGKYILAAKMRAGDEVTHEVLTRPGGYHALKENLRIKEVTVGDGERKRRYVVCHDPLEEERQRKHRERLVALLELELGSLQQLDGNRHSKRACELRTSAQFGRYLRENESGKLSIDRAAIRTIKIVEYERDGVRVRQTTELRPDGQQLLARPKIPMPPKLHDVQSQPDSRRPKTMPDRPADVAAGDGDSE